MQLSTIVKPGAVRTYPQVSSKKRLFQDIADLAAYFGSRPSQLRDLHGVD